jgi:hypothetical protein
MRSPRAALELLVARHGGRLPPLEVVAPERALGTVAEGAEPGRSHRRRSLQDRVDQATRAARLDGAAAVVSVGTRANPSGSGALGLNLPAGCHRLAVLADDSARGAPDGDRDLDAEVRRPGAAVAIRQDRSNAPDGRLGFCLGKAEPVELRFLGAGGPVDVAVLDASWPLPRAAALTTDPDGRGALAWALFRRRVPEVTDPPLLVARGGPGATQLPVPLEPGACYLVAMALVRGDAGAARLSAAVGRRIVRDQTTSAPQGGAVTFCAGAERDALLTVELRSGFGWWLLGLWQVYRGDG